MKISLHKLTNLYLTGTFDPSYTFSSEKKPTDFTKEECDDLEITQESFKASGLNASKFLNPTLNLNADFNTACGQFRMAGLGVINSFFSGIGSTIGLKINFTSGLALALTSLFTSTLKNISFLNKKFSFLSLGSNALIRGPLHILDSMFSTIGEQGSKYIFPSLLTSGISLLSLKRSMHGKENKSFKVPFDTIGGTLGRTAIHHVDSMLGSKASHISQANSSLGAFLGSSITTLGLMLPEQLRQKELSYETTEGFIAQGSSSFIDSLFSNIGNIFSQTFNSGNKLFFGSLGIFASIPIIGKFFNVWNYKIPYGTLEGRLMRGIFHAPESFVFNLGNNIGNSKFGIPASLLFGGFTALSALSKKSKTFLSNIKISRNTTKGLFERLPIEFMYSVISSSGVKLSKLIPAPILTLLGPSLSFRIGEKLKGISSKYDDLHGLMIRNSVHLWESILSRAAYRTGKIISGNSEGNISAGSIMSDGRWLTDEGRIVSTMAMGKQSNNTNNKNVFSVLSSLIVGVGFGSVIATAFKKFSFKPPAKGPLCRGSEASKAHQKQQISKKNNGDHLVALNKKEITYAS